MPNGDPPLRLLTEPSRVTPATRSRTYTSTSPLWSSGTSDAQESKATYRPARDIAGLLLSRLAG